MIYDRIIAPDSFCSMESFFEDFFNEEFSLCFRIKEISFYLSSFLTITTISSDHKPGIEETFLIKDFINTINVECWICGSEFDGVGKPKRVMS